MSVGPQRKLTHAAPNLLARLGRTKARSLCERRPLSLTLFYAPFRLHPNPQPAVV